MQDHPIWNNLKTAVIVTIIAILVWLYAEGRNVTEQTLTATVILVDRNPDLVVDQLNDQVRIKFRAATSKHEQIRGRLATGPIELPVELTPGPNNEPQAVSLMQRLATLPVLSDLGMTIISLQPEVLEARVEPIDTVDMPITVYAGDVALSQVTVTPETIKIRLPHSQAQNLNRTGHTLRADLTTLPNWATLPTNVPHTRREVPLIFPNSLRSDDIKSSSATTVEVVFTIRKQNQELTLSGVPIHINALWSELSRFDVNIDGGDLVLDQDIILNGPSDIIDRIDKKEIRIVAQLRLKLDDFVPGSHTSAADFNLPPNVTLVTAPPTIRYTITERQ